MTERQRTAIAIASIALIVASCADAPTAPPHSARPDSDASAAYWRGRIAECANVGDVLQRRKCLDTVERDQDRTAARSR